MANCLFQWKWSSLLVILSCKTSFVLLQKTVGALKRSNRGIVRGPGGKLKQNTTRSDVDDFRGLHQPDNWRTWSIQRAGFSDMEFEGSLSISFWFSWFELCLTDPYLLIDTLCSRGNCFQ